MARNYGLYDFPQQIEGDTLKGKSFTLEYMDSGVQKSLSGAKVMFQITKGRKRVLVKETSSDNSGEITIVNPLTGAVTVHNIDQPDDDFIPAGRYNWLLKVEFSDGLEHTFIGGKYLIVKLTEEEKISL